MARAWLLLALTAGLVCAAGQKKQEPTKPAEPPEEDETLAVKQYEFNPLQASQEIKVGEFYMKKGSFRAASIRFREATRWDPSNAEAHYKLGEALERAKDPKGAKEAYAKFIELTTDSKRAAAVRKRVERLR